MSVLSNNLGCWPCYGKFDITTYLPGSSDYEIMCLVIQKCNEVLQMAPLSVITYANPIQWNITTQYPKNTIVIEPNSGTAYMSVQPVPSGVDIDNTEYWVPVFSLEDMISKYKDAITTNREKSAEPSSKAYSINDLMWIEDNLYKAIKEIDESTVIVVGDNVVATSVSDELNSRFSQLYDTPTGYYDAENTAIVLGFASGSNQTVVYGDVHTYTPATQTITIEGR